MRGLLNELNNVLSTKYELNVQGVSNRQISYVRVPKTSSDHAFTNSKEWVNTSIKIAGSKHGGTFESAYCMGNHFIPFYKDSVIAACETQRIPICQPMSATAFSSIIQAGKVNDRGASVQQGEAWTCCQMATVLLIMEAVTLPKMTNRRHNLLSGLRRILMKRSHYTYSVIYQADQFSLPMWLAFKWLLAENTVIQSFSLARQ
jgi:hypothetical protein